jgi:hypothetical protein
MSSAVIAGMYVTGTEQRWAAPRRMGLAVTPSPYPSKVSEDEQQPRAGRDGGETRPILRLETRRLERRLPRLGVVRFREPSAAAEVEVAPLNAEGGARAFANALIAITIEAPVVGASDVDGWSERTRAIARVATADVLGCLPEYHRLAGSGRTGDERLLEAMRARDEQIRKRLAAANAALRDNVVRLVDQTRAALGPNVVDAITRQQRAFERMMRPAAVEMLRLNKQLDILRPSYLTQVEKMNRQMAGLRASLVPQFEQLSKLSEHFVVPRSTLSALTGADAAVTSLRRSYTGVTAGLARQLASVARPTYFGALQHVGRLDLGSSYLTSVSRLAEQFQAQLRPAYVDQLPRLFEQLRRPPWLDGLRSALLAPLDAYSAWLEREWSELKAKKKPAPVMFLLASLPAIVALPVLRALEDDDELLLARLEQELQARALAETLQGAVQRSAALDAVAKRHLVQGLAWVQQGQYVDAAPPLYQGLERAFKLVARERALIDGNNRFLVPAHRRRLRTIEDVFTYLGLDRLYIRFLRAWVFGEIGNLARHGDLGEDEHRRWVLRAVMAVVGWLEYLGGEEDAVEELVERLELERGKEEDEEAS